MAGIPVLSSKRPEEWSAGSGSTSGSTSSLQPKSAALPYLTHKVFASSLHHQLSHAPLFPFPPPSLQFGGKKCRTPMVTARGRAICSLVRSGSRA